MSEPLEHFGFPCSEPESKEVDHCRSCSCIIYDYERDELVCDCGRPVCNECRHRCDTHNCEWNGCKHCMAQDDESDWVCDECNTKYYEGKLQ